MGGVFQWAYGGQGDDRFYVESIERMWIDGGTDNDILDFSRSNQEVRVDLSKGLIWINALTTSISFTGIEDFYCGATPMRMTGTAGTDHLQTDSSRSMLYGGEGEDWLTVTVKDALTPANLGYWQVIVNGGGAVDHIVAYRGATLNGDAGDDDITGSDFTDEIHGGSGNDTINAKGGNDDFSSFDLDGIDRINAGDDVDSFNCTNGKMADFDFFLAGFDLADFGIQKTGVANNGNVMLFQNLERTYFYESYWASSGFKVGDARALLLQDADHYMTGAEMKAALIAAGNSTAPPPMTGYGASDSSLSP